MLSLCRSFDSHIDRWHNFYTSLCIRNLLTKMKDMEFFKKKDFERLANVHNPNCVTIYIPTHRTNDKGEGMYKDKTTLKNQLKDARKQLEILEMKPADIEDHLKPINNLIEDTEFWKKRSDGLAIFYDGDELMTYAIPKVFTPYTHVEGQFYLKPMADLLHGAGRHFILQLALGDVRFYEATHSSITDVRIEDLVPEELLETVGSDFEPKTLQSRTGQGEQGEFSGMFHGHGDGSESEKKEEALKFFREINDGLMKMLHDEDAPMVVACVDYLFPIYKEANTYKYLKNEHVSGNFEHSDLLELKEKAWDIVKDQFEIPKKEAEKKVPALLNEGKSSTTLEDVVASSIIGRTDTLFIKEDEEVWGKYHEDEGKVEINEVRKVGDTGLLNLAAIKTVEKGGKVYIVSQDEMPVENSTVNAVYRYEM